MRSNGQYFTGTNLSVTVNVAARRAHFNKQSPVNRKLAIIDGQQHINIKKNRKKNWYLMWNRQKQDFHTRSQRTFSVFIYLLPKARP